MTLDTVHPELDAEQSYVDRAYACMAVMLSEVEAFGPHGRNDFEREAFERWQRARVAALSDTKSALVFGRIDERHEGETFYIGRHNVRDGHYDTVVIDWRAPVARAFYQANRKDPMGLRLRRQFLVEGREILGISDDALDADGLRGAEILDEELRKQRGGRMRDIVATIQAEQDVIIRAPLEGIVVVQGGPGTGKTAIGLHRAAFLLYEHRRTLQRRGVLVVGPNPVFMRYVSQVLPSLGESAMTQLAIDDLAPSVRSRAHDDTATVRLKGDARMAEVIRRALADRGAAPEADVEIAVHGVRFVLRARDVERQAQTLRERGVPFRNGRALLREDLLLAAYRSYEGEVETEAVAASFEEVTRAVRRDRSFRETLDRVWPAVTGAALVADLFASPARLARAAEGVLTNRERELLRRTRGGRWTQADRPLLDEAQALVEGPPDRYGHVVVDEAQDLSPMQLRMLARRCPEGSMTILGDLAQATGAWAHDGWDEVLGHLPGPEGARVEELTLGYRVGAAVMEVAERVLLGTGVRTRAPRAVRRERGEVKILRTGDMGTCIAEEARAMVERLGVAAIIAPGSLVAEARHALAEAGLAFGEAETEGLDGPLTLVPVARAKGLEFDGVVLLEPDRIAEEGGPRLLYVALTRAMRSLTIISTAELLPEAAGTRGGRS